ncbi:hypothetical protein BOW53_02870 [Solemya pervernicosa gill symbiont]|uniref:GemA protein n=1 Tax=Solemya pervernicosa gill symbiont TaxID=642797 RepID=A0A1T2L942_9GAMM|nr:phage protein GemA/Gp16 family protein [Solemya pervernicosa gill symbiont]OOZ41638.1 hypothetical protein BOW53_02870 [Solemya pervernicosa gill symbiont]
MSSRNDELAKIHIGKKSLGLEDDAYKAMLWTVARVRSSKDLDEQGRHDVIEHLKSRGVVFTKGKRPHNYNRLPGYITKVEAMVADMKLPWEYVDAIAYNITGGKGKPEHDKAPGVKRLAWVKEGKHWRAIIAALSVEQKKRAHLESIDEYLEKLGRDRNWVEEFVRVDNWTRHMQTLEAVHLHLANECMQLEES